MALAPITNYSTLTAAVAHYLTRADVDPAVFVQAAHVRLCRQIRALLWVATANVTVNAERVAVPTGFRSVIAAKIGTRQIEVTTPENRQRMALGLTAGDVQAMSVEGAFLAFAPVPGATQTLVLQYTAVPDILSDTNTTNALLTRYPMAYLYGTCAEAARWLQDESLMAVYEGLVAREIAEINTQDQNDALAGNSLAPKSAMGIYLP